MITVKLIERALRSADELRSSALKEFDGLDIIPDAAGVILVLGDAVLPGYVSKIVSNLHTCDASKVIQQLEAEDPFRDARLTTWIEREGETYPGTIAYALALDEVRRLALDFVTHTQGEIRDSN